MTAPTTTDSAIDNQEPDTYVNTAAMIESSSKEVVYTKLLPPYTQTLFVELIRFSTSSSDVANGTFPPPSAPTPPHFHPRPVELGQSSSRRHSHPLPTPPTPVHELVKPPSTNGHQVPPPPPWSTQWHTITSNPPPARRSEVPEHTPPQPPQSSQSLSASPHSGKKRKFATDESPPPEPTGSRSPKQPRRLPQTPVLPSASVPARAMQQTLSPSLAMIVSPVDTEPSPRPSSSIPFLASTPLIPKSSRPSDTPPTRNVNLLSKNK